MPKISIIVPNYNHAPNIENLIKSLHCEKNK
jgi:glycosyltransferase involved in cell wall biosynthesis